MPVTYQEIKTHNPTFDILSLWGFIIDVQNDINPTFICNIIFIIIYFYLLETLFINRFLSILNIIPHEVAVAADAAGDFM